MKSILRPFHLAFPVKDLEDTYIDQHKAILSGDFSNNCTLAQGLKTMEIIVGIQNARYQ